MRSSNVSISRSSFFRGAIFGGILVVVKLVIVLPVDVADILYAAAILITVIITAGEVTGSSLFVLKARPLNFVLGFLFPLDCYAVLVLFGLPLPS